MRYGLSQQVIHRIHEVLSHFPEVEKAVLYGSRAKGEFKRGSDIDLTLVGSRVGERTLSRIEEELEELLLPYRFDLSAFSEITQAELIEHIERIGVVFYDGRVVKIPV